MGFVNGDGTARKPQFKSGSGGGKFPKKEELFGELVMLTPVEVVKVQKYKGKPGETSERLTADTVVLTGQFAGEEFSEMWWTPDGIIKTAKAELRKPVDQRNPILGRLIRFPQNATRDEYPTAEAIEAGIVAFNERKIKEMPGFAWGLSQFTQEEEDIAVAYLNGDRPTPEVNASDDPWA
jgi:hypothetical protein